MPADDPMPDNNLLAPVRFALEIEALEASFAVRRFEIDERLSRPYSLDVEVITADTELDPEELLGASCQLSLVRDRERRSFAGVILGVELTASGGERLGLQLTVGPALSLLEHRQDRRIWEQTSAVDIIADVIDGPLAAHGREARWELDTMTYEPREYCVQHGESDLDFVHRLLAQEGIYYYFEVEEGREIVIFADQSSRAPLIRVDTADADRAERGSLLFIDDGAGSTGEEALREFVWRRRLVSSATQARSWSWLAAQEPMQERALEDFAPDPGVANVDGDRTVYETIGPSPRSDGAEEREHRVRHERRALAAGRGRGSGDAIHLSAGRRFALLGHPDPSCDRGYLLTRAHHRGDAPEAQLHAHSEGPLPRYRVHLECIDEQTPYRPPTPAKRRPQIETAIVVGPPNSGIHTDEHGRVQVRFHWDRRSGDAAASCWLRVTQSWAGNGFGTLFIPRIGHEVVVDYLGGDPDRPLVVGSLYNSLQTPPFTLPEHKQVSGLKSDSNPGGGGHHELSFDDTKGRETLRIRAQRDMVENVLHDRTSTVGREQKVSIGELHSCESETEVFTVRDSAERNVGGTYDVTVVGDMTTFVEQGAMRTIVKLGDHRTEVSHGDFHTYGGGNFHTYISESIFTTAKNGVIKFDAQRWIGFIAGDDFWALARKGELRLDAKAGELKAHGKSGVQLTSTSGNIEIQASKSVTVNSQMFLTRASQGVCLESPKMIVLKCGTTTLTLSPTGITLSAGTITSSAIGPHVIKGATINLN